MSCSFEGVLGVVCDPVRLTLAEEAILLHAHSMSTYLLGLREVREEESSRDLDFRTKKKTKESASADIVD